MIAHIAAVSRGCLPARLAVAGIYTLFFLAGVTAQTAPVAPSQSVSDSTVPSSTASQKSTPGAPSEEAGGTTEEELKHLLVGKPLFLRGGYLSDSLNYSEHGSLVSSSPQASYTLCGVQIEKVRLTRRKVELVGARYGLHFLGALPYEDPSRAIDRVRVTPRKKTLRITIDREQVIKPKKPKGSKAARNAASPQAVVASAAGPSLTPEISDAPQEAAAAILQQTSSDPRGVTTTTSPAHAARVLKEALAQIFAPDLDARMIAAMPDFWKLYYQSAASKTDYRPSDPAVMRQTTVDRKARLITAFEPGSNQYAQDNGVAGMSLYHVIVDASGKPVEIAVARPIGFGLDENAVKAISDARFEPAVKNGKTVSVLLDLVVQFRIYSKRTGEVSGLGPKDQGAGIVLPGPYSAQRP